MPSFRYQFLDGPNEFRLWPGAAVRCGAAKRYVCNRAGQVLAHLRQVTSCKLASSHEGLGLCTRHDKPGPNTAPVHFQPREQMGRSRFDQKSYRQFEDRAGCKPRTVSFNRGSATIAVSVRHRPKSGCRSVYQVATSDRRVT